MRAKPKPWPNKLGWDIGSARVMDCETHYVVHVPVGPRVDPHPTEPDRFVETDRTKMCRVPHGMDPVEAVKLCRRYGRVFLEGEPGELPLVDGFEGVNE